LKEQKYHRGSFRFHRQSEVGIEGYDAGAQIYMISLKKELQNFISPDLSPVGKRIIDACMSGATVEEYNSIIPMNYHIHF